MANKNCGLYIRVSSEKQASIEEGSLKNQEEQLRRYVQMKNIDGERWTVVDTYIDGGKSAKDTNRPEYQRLQRDTHDGKVDTVIVCALSRISRSVRDLLDMVDDFNKRGVDFICLKEKVDTTSAVGKLFLTMMGALNQFEREQTSERTIRNMRTRAERGLIHGGYLLGYDFDPNKKGNRIPNTREAELVRFAFKTYLECGSIEKTADILNEHGYTSKSYVSSRGKSHGGRRFGYSETLNVLTNKAYIGIREINKLNKSKKQSELPEDQRYCTCPATWKAIVDKETFDQVQVLIRENLKHKNNGAVSTKHHYLFNRGLLSCHKCGSRMEGRNGHGHTGKIYYYYYCTNEDCRFKVREDELIEAIQRIVKAIISRPETISRIAQEVNSKLFDHLPRLRACRESIRSEIADLKTEFSQLTDSFSDMRNGKEFIEEKLSELDRRKASLNGRLELVDTDIACYETKAIGEDRVQNLLLSLDKIFQEDMKLYQKRILLSYVLTYLKLCDDKLEIGIGASKFRTDITQVLRFDGTCPTPPGSQIDV